MTKEIEKKPIAPTLKALHVGEVTSFPLNRIAPVSVACTRVNMECGRKFSTHIDRTNHIVEVRRLF